MAIAKITLIGFNNYMLSQNDDLFKYVTLPAGLDKDTLTNNILLRGGEFEVLYADPYFMQNMIKVWSDKWQRTFSKWWETLNISYDPLFNYDRHEEYTDIHAESEATSKKEDAFASDIAVNKGSGETANTVSAFDSANYQPHDKAETKSEGSSDSVSTTNAIGNNTRDTLGSNKHDAHLYGNIGVTTSQQMLKDELDVDAWNIYEHITDLFLNEFCIYVYE